MIYENLQIIRQQLPSDVALVAVSKFHPVSAILEAYDAGQRVFGENRPQELAAKVPLLPADIQWHFIGHLQTNKLKLVLPYVTLAQSVDSLHLLEAIQAWAETNHRLIDVLLELHLGAEETKHGFTEDEILQLVCGEGMLGFMRSSERPTEAVSDEGGLIGRELQGDNRGAEPTSNTGPGRRQVPSASPSPQTGVRIRGLMGMATNTDDVKVIEKDFERIERLFRRIQAMGLPDFDQLSIGMSGDWPLAVKHGATMVRIGTDIFGEREY